MRDSPPELDRSFDGPYASSSRTRCPARFRKCAVQEPKTPAPIMATSKVFLDVRLMARILGRHADQESVPANAVLRMKSRRSTIFLLNIWFSSPSDANHGAKRRNWLRGLDSNQDSQLQRLVSYQLDDPGTDDRSVAEARKRAQAARECGRCASLGSFC